jgi:hypothetical protein
MKDMNFYDLSGYTSLAREPLTDRCRTTCAVRDTVDVGNGY